MANQGRKIPKKSKRPKRRYILFSLANVSNPKKAFELLLNPIPLLERKKLGLWFIEFRPDSGKGIVRCHLGKEEKVKRAILSLPKQFSPKPLKTSGTLKALGQK